MRVLITYDGSTHSDIAVADLQLAGLCADTEVVVVSVLDCRSCRDRKESGDQGLSGQSSADFSEARDRQLAVAETGAELAQRLFPSWKVTSEVRIGSPAWEIIQRAEGDGEASDNRPFDLVVVGSRGHGELKRLFLGSVAHRVITSLRGSVRVARGKPDRLASASSGMAPPRILVGVDGSTDANAAVKAVAYRAWPVGTRIIMAAFETGPLAMVRHWEPNTIWGGTPIALDSPAADGRPALRVVSEAADFVRQRRPDLSVATLVKPADPKYALLGAAEEWDKDGADCIFVGASGVRGLERFLLGSVSTSVALNATCSVEIVRHGG
ncbi:MAG: universal stress protein [Phycisphaerales bacterium]|nr:universal stress protein [Phycisphaerales bacterium]